MGVRFKPSAKQAKAWLLLTKPKYKETRFIGYGGSAFSGKSYLGCWWLVTQCVGNTDLRYALCRRELIVLKRTTLKTLFKVMQEIGLIERVDFTYNSQYGIVKFLKTKSEILLIDLAYKPSNPEYDHLGGLELTGGYIDESVECPQKAIEILFTRTGRWNNGPHAPRKLLETFNPNKNHVHKRYWVPFRDNNETNFSRFIKALPEDNPSPDVPEYIDGIVRIGNKVAIERLILGNFDYSDDETQLISYDKILDLWTNSFVEHGQRYITADVAGMGSDLFVFVVWDGWRVLHIKTMAKNSGPEGLEVFEKLRKAYGVPMSNIAFDADGIGSLYRGFLQGSRAFNNGAKALRRENYKNLKTQCYYHFAKQVTDGKMYISKKSKHDAIIIEELEQIKRHKMDEDGKLQLMPKADVKLILGRSPDYSDALMMRSIFELQPKTTGAYVAGV